MPIRKDAAESNTRNIEVDRLEWLTILRHVPEQTDPTLRQMVADLRMGSENTGAPIVMLERWQVREVLRIVDAIPALQVEDDNT